MKHWGSVGGMAGQSTRSHGPAIFCVGDLCSIILGALGASWPKRRHRQDGGPITPEDPAGPPSFCGSAVAEGASAGTGLPKAGGGPRAPRPEAAISMTSSHSHWTQYYLQC